MSYSDRFSLATADGTGPTYELLTKLFVGWSLAPGTSWPK